MKNRKIVIEALILNFCLGLLGGCGNVETIAEHSVTENTITEETSVSIALTNNADMNVISNAITSAVDEHLDNDRIIVVPDENAVYTITPDVENGEIDSSMTYPDYRMSVKTTSGKSATFDPNSGEVSLEGNQSDYKIKLSFNDNVGDLPWFSVTAYGKNANHTSLKQADEGMILTSDNLKESNIVAYNREEQVGVAFSTDESSLQIKAVDPSTLGVYVDSDADGTYDLLIADSNGNNYS